MESIEKTFKSTIIAVMRPLARILLKYGIPFGTFSELAKRAYVTAAMEDFALEGRKPSVSRVSVLTGLSRKEVSRVLAAAGEDKPLSPDRYNRAARVIGGWVRDPAFHDADGNPGKLPVEGDDGSFSELVRLYSGDVPARAILDELLRVGSVVQDDDGYLHLVSRAYVPRTGQKEKVQILGSDVADLIWTIDNNMDNGGKEPRFQRKVSYDNLPEEALPELRELARTHSQELLELLDRWMSAHDRDVGPRTDGAGRNRAGVGIYYFEEDITNR